MKPSLARPPRFRLAEREGPRVILTSDQGWRAELFVLEPEIVRVLITSADGLAAPRTWSIAPGAEDAPAGGRDRRSTDGFSCPDFTIEATDEVLTLATDALRLRVRLAGLFLDWEMRAGGAWTAIARDRPTQAYDFGWQGPGTRHYLAREAGERYLGLGEVAGPLDHAGRRYRLSPTDALGYDAALSDPLYKHIAFYITEQAATGLAFGLFYDTTAAAELDFGCERSNYHGLFRSFRADGADLDYYLIAGPTVLDATRRFTWLTGRPMLPPRWALGYSGSAMAYTDAPDAQARLAGFAAACRAHDILCDSLHLSSGYGSIGARRYVFHWNRDKFPDPPGFARDFHAAGLRLIANIKPCLLADHPRFEEARGAGLLVSDADGEPAWAQFWDGLGAWLDFTNPATEAWWRGRVEEDLLGVGIDSTWNDNNEFEIASPEARAALFGAPAPARLHRPLQTLLMLRASRTAQARAAPDRRPLVVSRSGGAGLQRYAQTWSGDNATSWETLRWNLRMGLGLALSGVSNAGHDIGGFAGPKPDPELFVRWVEAGVFMPRFVIHSWNDDGTTNEPWMHPEATALVRELIGFRYRLIPTLYDLAWRHHASFEPIVRPLFAAFPADRGLDPEADALMLGLSLLSAPVVHPGATSVRLRTPGGVEWADFWSGERVPAGAEIELPAPLGRPPLIVREGSAIGLNIARQSFDARADERAFALFAGPGGAFETTLFEDDGESPTGDAHGFWRLGVEASRERIAVDAAREGPRPPAGALWLLVRPGETRPIVGADGRALEFAAFEGWRRASLAPR